MIWAIKGPSSMNSKIISKFVNSHPATSARDQFRLTKSAKSSLTGLSGESKVDQLRSSPPVPLARLKRGRPKGSVNKRKLEVVVPSRPKPRPIPKPVIAKTPREVSEKVSATPIPTVEGLPTTRSAVSGPSKVSVVPAKTPAADKGKGRAVSASPPPVKKPVRGHRTDMESQAVKHPLARAAVEIPYRFDVELGEAYSVREVLESGRTMSAEHHMPCLTCVLSNTECNYLGKSEKCEQCKTHRHLCNWILPQEQAFAQMDRVREWGGPTPARK
ncbi:hypothetical protein E1B28_012622 [Marasmius oreades]|uniref:Uncharacterized protein n=1 Tax=Marasmius oreades TaxID=181124 RepID=A0A9P7RS18_9AGAR|nr:uncharacterized protein E1B28_012622 [Marasmius oreades]KAG7088650.1 hypothetical protein E1B28_012622 [Marasmius oreades]